MGGSTVPTIIGTLVGGPLGGVVANKQYKDTKAAKDEQEKMQAQQRSFQQQQMVEMNTPAPRAVDPSAVDFDAKRKKRLEQLRSGLASTIKTSPMGAPAPLNAIPKTKLGQ